MTTRNAQLSLIETPRAWRIDNHTREVGREGIARARAALRAGRQARSQDPPARPARASKAGGPGAGRRRSGSGRAAA
jgi:hypothetical protein